MNYKLLSKILTADKILDIWQAEQADKTRKEPILQAIRINEQVEAILVYPKYARFIKH